MILPGPPTGRQRPSVAVIMVCIVLGIFVLVIAAYINKDFLVRRHLDVGKLPDVPEFKHKKKPGGGYVKGSPLYEKQQGHRATEMILPGPPTGRQRPSVAVIMVCIVLGIFVLVIAA